MTVIQSRDAFLPTPVETMAKWIFNSFFVMHHTHPPRELSMVLSQLHCASELCSLLLLFTQKWFVRPGEYS